MVPKSPTETLLISPKIGKYSIPYHLFTDPQSIKWKGRICCKDGKNILKKSNRDGTDEWQAIPDWRNTPAEGQSSSPVQKLMSRRTQTLLPTMQALLQPKVVENVTKENVLRRQK
ncbi:hypothetical protein HOLleu_37993 [Holothuria leucospilota]|uniref:Uncharacterized protein n=1 Tax=Holothuria leucospilota TaxID=206669 RepID=A0A9Q0YMK8_HOLLE|nr:hypothetical protein HOLleu_37993 [Holothuria leucospilota]